MSSRSNSYKKQWAAAKNTCANCGGGTDGSYYCPRCKAQRAERQKARRQQKIIDGICTKCSNPAKKGSKHCSDCLNKQKEYRRSRKIAVFEAYGGVQCNCCGEDTVEFLTIDHINNDGAEHRRELAKNGRALGDGLYGWLIKEGFPEGFQVLCANCQLGKQINDGVCPHQV